MNCLEFARRLRTEPDGQDIEWRQHREECTPCAALASRAQGFERLLHEALSIVERPKVPADLASRILSRQVFHEAPKRRSQKTRVYALAASLLVTLGVVALMLANQGPKLEDDVVRHVRSETHAMQLRKHITPQALRSMLRPLNAELHGDLGPVTFAGLCSFRHRVVAHLVMQGDAAPVTVLLMPHEPVSTRVTFRDDDLVGTLVPVRGGSMAIVSDPNQALEQVEGRLRSSVRWLL